MKGYILYDYSSQQALVPNLITLAAVLNAIPLEASSSFLKKTTNQVFDLTATWATFSPLDATSYMFNNYINETSTLSWMNPGYDNAADPKNPPLTKSPNPSLIDFIVSKKIFNFYMNDACIPNTPDYTLMTSILQINPWPKPVAVWGYGDTYPVAGDIFEAETDCTKEHSMGQIATVGVSNLAFFARQAAITEPLLQNVQPVEVYNASKTYLSLVMGDGDNIQFLKAARRDWMMERVSRCPSSTNKKAMSKNGGNDLDCFPLTWSISPHIWQHAPDIARWYYTQAATTGHDYFMLPPSGDLYSYPSAFSDELQVTFARNTAQDSYLMNTSGTVHWEWFGHWKKATTQFLPKYSSTAVKGIFPVNVPFNVPMIEVFAPADPDCYKILAQDVVMFRPREWRGTSPSNIPLSHREYLSVDEMAKELNTLPQGSVTWIYLTSDGGGHLDNVYDLVSKLDEHVLVVNHEVLTDLAFQRG